MALLIIPACGQTVTPSLPPVLYQSPTPAEISIDFSAQLQIELNTEPGHCNVECAGTVYRQSSRLVVDCLPDSAPSKITCLRLLIFDAV